MRTDQMGKVKRPLEFKNPARVFGNGVRAYDARESCRDSIGKLLVISPRGSTGVPVSSGLNRFASAQG